MRDWSYFSPMWNCVMRIFLAMFCIFAGERGYLVSGHPMTRLYSLYCPHLPLIFVLGTATSQSVIHSMLPVALRAKLAVESFQLQRGLSTFENLMRGVSRNNLTSVSRKAVHCVLSLSFSWMKNSIWALYSRVIPMSSSRTATHNMSNPLIHSNPPCRYIFIRFGTSSTHKAVTAASPRGSFFTFNIRVLLQRHAWRR